MVMDTIHTVKEPCDAIVAFTPELDRPMSHTVLYQVRIDPAKVSPSGEYIRFDHGTSEIHGWKRIDQITIFEILQVITQAQAEAA
jgi:hypothetical protein